MRRLIICISLMLFISLPGIAGHAELEPVAVDIAVEVENGGTAVMIADADAPAPVLPRLEIEEGVPAAFHIVFSTVGTFSYTLKTEPDSRDLDFDKTVYHIAVYVTEEKGRLCTAVVVYKTETGEKYFRWDEHDEAFCSVVFYNTPKKPAVSPTPAITPTPTRPPDQPQTGGDFRLEIYLLTAIAASASLLVLSILYYYSVNRDMKRKHLS